MPDATADDRISYNYSPTREEWDAWKATVPRTISLYERLDQLLEWDREHDLDALIAQQDMEAENRSASADVLVDAIERADPEDGEVRLAAVRIRRRCMTALPNAREHGADTAAEELAEIQQIANDLLELE